MSGVISPLPNTPSWCGAQLKNVPTWLYLYPFWLFGTVEVKKIRGTYRAIGVEMDNPNRGNIMR